ncbi:hypothetical protein ACIFOT_01180 [Neobacillus sp. NRS-1170]|uniref:hypothetical protein n=1 Tax=Neobacillus sp. NRS-1170 TaxID=3233898 RepID=UPI003D289B38
MPAMDNDSYDSYIKLEKKINRKMKRMANSYRVVAIVDKGLDLHLDRVQFQRMMVNDWLDSNGYAIKDEIAHVAKKHILIEAKVDDLEEKIFRIVQEWNKKKKLLTVLNENLHELNKFMNEENIEN